MLSEQIKRSATSSRNYLSSKDYHALIPLFTSLVQRIVNAELNSCTGCAPAQSIFP